MNPYLLLLFSCLLGTLVQAQRLPSKKFIDSIAQQRWEQQTLSIDSLSRLTLHPLKTKAVDTLMPPNEGMIEVIKEEPPVTPYHFLKMKTPQKWFFWGQNNIEFNQSSFSNWNAGGNNSIGIIAKLDYNISYKKNEHYWENIIKMGYGFNSTQGQSSRKTEDYLNIMSNYGYEIGKNYYLSTGIQLLTQFMPGYNYSATPDPSYADRISKFMAPGYFNAGVGISYNPNKNFQAIFRPANAKLTFVLDKDLQRKDRYGLERDGQSLRAELGAMLTLLYRIQLYKDILFTSRLGLFTNYLEHMERVDVNYNGTIDLKFNQFISTTFNINLLYDHDQIQRVQLKQTLGVGFLYNFGVDEKKKAPKKKNKLKPFILKPIEVL
ncbi:DUF3078 domain-containing protein [Riemerella columbina]|uniref:DUF3078 domain-containing protein n=1 Tax=Riemerella columbina TaxID=103810 RepID=UPI00266EFE85|nr:DUF3078 domain-containing protein [Riemerella columbina]WKS95418.1 DUF3078 domain-containing protein [Riemerella columbina]